MDRARSVNNTRLSRPTASTRPAWLSPGRVTCLGLATLLAPCLLVPCLLGQGPPPAPRFPDGTPNLGSTTPGRGVWVRIRSRDESGVFDMGAAAYLREPRAGIPYQPWAKARAAFNRSAPDKHDPTDDCLPPGVPR